MNHSLEELRWDDNMSSYGEREREVVRGGAGGGGEQQGVLDKEMVPRLWFSLSPVSSHKLWITASLFSYQYALPLLKARSLRSGTG